jgi:hypothetical protein
MDNPSNFKVSKSHGLGDQPLVGHRRSASCGLGDQPCLDRPVFVFVFSFRFFGFRNDLTLDSQA